MNQCNETFYIDLIIIIYTSNNNLEIYINDIMIMMKYLCDISIFWKVWRCQKAENMRVKRNKVIELICHKKVMHFNNYIFELK